MNAAGRFLVRALCILAGGLASAFPAEPAHAQEPRRARPNNEFRLIEPQKVATGDRIEVIDFFWYGCPHCYNLQPALEEWIRRKPADVAVRRIPVILRDSWAPHARIYYTLEALGELERLHQQVYHGYHVQELHMSKPEVMAQWAVRHGIEREKWLGAYNSSDVAQKVQQAKALTRAYDVQGTPSLVVDGRYLTSAGLAGGLSGMIPILDELVRLARQQRAAK
ncbi:MAG: thiol:disulfide interchange protein DsbA/DsbL [Betaproteobacteria bacterium]|nr:thiol:disulfide interchange protein DsbA/DsbL [Betaproteobacteria bacterium]